MATQNCNITTTAEVAEPYEVDSERSASSKALNTTEILQHILSFLAGGDLIAAVNVNNFFYNCAANSPAIQKTMWLRTGVNPAPQCYMITRTRADQYGIHQHLSTLGMTPCARMQADDVDQQATPIHAVRLCPALREHAKCRTRCSRAERLIAAPLDAIYANTKFSFTIQPAYMERFGSAMSLTDPPVNSAQIELVYSHVGSSYVARASPFHYDRQESPLTLRTLIKKARMKKTSILVKREHYKSCWVKNISLNVLLSDYIRAHGGFFLLDLEASWIQLPAVAPTSEEWASMRAVLAEEEVKRMSMDPKDYAAWVQRVLERSIWRT